MNKDCQSRLIECGKRASSVYHGNSKLSLPDRMKACKAIIRDILHDCEYLHSALDETCAFLIRLGSDPTNENTKASLSILALKDYLSRSFNESTIESSSLFASGFLGSAEVPSCTHLIKGYVSMETPEDTNDTIVLIAGPKNPHHNASIIGRLGGIRSLSKVVMLSLALSSILLGSQWARLSKETGSRSLPGSQKTNITSQEPTNPELKNRSQPLVTGEQMLSGQSNSPSLRAYQPIHIQKDIQSMQDQKDFSVSGRDLLKIVSPGSVMLTGILPVNEHTRIARGVLRYNNGNLIKGDFLVNCQNRTIDPRDFVFLSKDGMVIKSGEKWRPEFVTRWSAEILLISKACQ